MSEPNTIPQQQNALVALNAYANHVDGQVIPNSEEDYVTDLLTDLRHLCAHLDISFYDVVGRSYQHFLGERK